MRKRWSWLYGGGCFLLGLAALLIGAVLSGVPVPAWAPLVMWVVACGWIVGCVAALWSIR